MKKQLKHKIFPIISESASELNIRAFVIGGFVRDLFLKRNSKDIDIVTDGSGIELARQVGKKTGSKIKVYKNFGTAAFKYQQLDIEFVGARKESYRANSRKPIVENGSLEDDQNRRDFTINAMAISLNPKDYGKLIDPFNGVDDLKNKLIRTPLDPDITFSDDPLRMMRAIRFATQLGFTILPETLNAIRMKRDRIGIISKERIIEELNKIIASDHPSRGFYLLDETGLLELIFPEFCELKGIESKNGIKHKDNFIHTLKVLDNLSENSGNLWLRWSAILHDIAKPQTKRFDPNTGWTFHGHNFFGAKMVPRIFKNMKLPLNEKMKFVQKMVSLHMRPIALVEEEVTDSAIRRLLFEAGDDIEELMQLCEADITSANKEKIRRFLENFKIVRQKLKEIEEKDRIRNWQPPIDGDLIMNTFDLGPCKEVGIIKNAIKEAILDGLIRNSYEEAYQFMIEEGEKLGLTEKNKKYD